MGAIARTCESPKMPEKYPDKGNAVLKIDPEIDILSESLEELGIAQKYYYIHPGT